MFAIGPEPTASRATGLRWPQSGSNPPGPPMTLGKLGCEKGFSERK